MTTNPILTAMAERLAQPAHWTSHTGARDLHGSPVSAIDPDAACFCLLGARARAQFETGNLDYYDAQQAGRRLSRTIRTHWPTRAGAEDTPPAGVIASFNDHPETTHADVVRLLEIANQ